MTRTPPKRIISLVPSLTQTLYDLGLEDWILGITDFCPLKNQGKAPPFRIGGPKNPEIAFISKLNPDLILANPEENPLEVIEKLKLQFPILTFQPKKLNDGLALILEIGKLTKSLSQAKQLVSEIKKEMAETEKFLRSKEPKRCVYLIWKNPYMTINQDTYIHDFLKTCNCQNPFASSKKRYPWISIEQIENARPDIIFLPDEPYPFKQRDKKDFSTIPSKIILVDGRAACWYGSYLKGALSYFRKVVWTH